VKALYACEVVSWVYAPRPVELDLPAELAPGAEPVQAASKTNSPLALHATIREVRIPGYS
jgi:hypothetical protein